jgi:hypothetical protein
MSSNNKYPKRKYTNIGSYRKSQPRDGDVPQVEVEELIQLLRECRDLLRETSPELCSKIVSTCKAYQAQDYPRTFIKLEQSMKDGQPYGDIMFPITFANGKKLNSGDCLTLFSKKGKKAPDYILYDVTISELDEDAPKKPTGKPPVSGSGDDIAF